MQSFNQANFESDIPSSRSTVVDVIRGFALVGVLIANFTSYSSQLVPFAILQRFNDPLDHFLINFNAVVIEWKFMTLFSILFGYGFGLILNSLEKKNINPEPFFLRRMGWLFIIGLIHCLFWWADVLHFYAISGVLLLLFRKKSDLTIIITSLVCMFFVPMVYSFLVRNQPSSYSELDFNDTYHQLKNGTLFAVFKTNIVAYYKMFILSWSDISDILETLGRFLFGYYLLRIGLFDSVEKKKNLFRKIMRYCAPLMVLYFVSQSLGIYDLDLSLFYFQPFIKLGLLATTCFYASALVNAFIYAPHHWIFKWLQSLGRMTLTNYLLISAIQIVLLYGIGFGRLGELPMTKIWQFALLWLAVEILFSRFWLSRYRYGPVEWIWRQLTYGTRIPLSRS